MTARHVHAVLAAGVQSPNLIDAWRTDPHALRAHGIEPGSIDLSALWKFSGFTLKVRHNGVRNLLPMSFRLMGVAGLEIDFFASYASFCAANGRAYSGTLDERCRRLVEFMEHWLDLNVKEHVLLWDVIRHERALVALAELPLASNAPARREASSPAAAPTGASVPRVDGHLALYEMSSDPSATAAALAHKKPVLDDVALETRYYGYWRPESSTEPQIVELDAFGYYALSNADGTRSAAELSDLVGCGPRPTPSFLRSLGQLAGAGLIRFDPASAGVSA